MKKITAKLLLGDVMSSGEVVVSLRKATNFGGGNPKMSVGLKNLKTGKHRLASWNYWGTVFLRSSMDPSTCLNKGCEV